MIGTNIRSVRHLYRVSDTSLRMVLVNFRENRWEFCKVMKMPTATYGEVLLIFNNFFRHGPFGYESAITSNEFKKLHKQEDVLDFSRLIVVSSLDDKSPAPYLGEIILLPESFEKDYEAFLKENAKLMNALSSNYGISPTDNRVKRLYVYADGSKNFLQWATTMAFKNRVDISLIKDILLWNESYKQLAKNLSKGTITAYTSKDSIQTLVYELSELRKEKRINDSINSFNTAQKKLLKETDLNDSDRQALWKLSRLSDAKRLNFIKKMSSITDINELLRQLRFVTSVHFGWSKESFLDFLANVENIKFEKIFENDNVILIKVLDYETVKQLGKTTNWCISKNKQYWNNYVEGLNGQATQYMVFDFSKVEDDKFSIIGFTTTHNKGITSAHNFINDNLMGRDDVEQVLLKSFISNFKEEKNIYSILGNLGIDVSLVVEYDAPQYEWDRECLMKYLYECVDKDNVEILMSKGNKMALSIVDRNLSYFFGDTYFDNIPSDYCTYQHIVFIDFSKSKYDINKIQFAIIQDGGDEDFCIDVYNEHSLASGCDFNSLLIDFELPYNTIRRTNNPITRLRNGLSSYNMPMVRECMRECSTKDLKNLLSEEIGYDQVYDWIIRTVCNYVSFDYLDFLYDNGIKISDLMSVNYIGDLIRRFTSDIRAISRRTNNFTNMEGITEKEIEDFYAFKLNRREDIKYVGLYLAIKKIIENEKLSPREYNELIKVFMSDFCSQKRQIEVYEQIIDLVKDKLDYSAEDKTISSIARYAVFDASEPLKKFIEQKAENSKTLKKLLEHFHKEFEKENRLLKKKEGENVVLTSTITNNRYDYGNLFFDLHPTF